MKWKYLILSVFLFLACQPKEVSDAKIVANFRTDVAFDLDQAEYLAGLPLNCIQNRYPYKSGLVIAGPEDLQLPVEHHPAFYGCFDWHSAVHGHWSLVYLLKSFPELSVNKKARQQLGENLTKENIEKELAYFSLNKNTKSFERTYGWAWLLKLAEELETWDDPDAKQWASNLKPLVDFICDQYIDYLPKLVYPIRVGEHSNTAFGLSFAYDYAISSNRIDLKEMIESRAKFFYLDDVNCPIEWEPSGYDFLSPCLQEIDIMRKILPIDDFKSWIEGFMPSLVAGNMQLSPGQVKDRSDGKLVHLDGLNFSRAWCLYPLSKRYPISGSISDSHFNYSIKKITDGDYSGEHWLGSFALYALKMNKEHAQ